MREIKIGRKGAIKKLFESKRTSNLSKENNFENRPSS